MQSRPRPFHLLFAKPLFYSWPVQQQVQQPIQQIQPSSPLLEAARFHSSLVNPFRSFLQKQAYLQSTYSASPSSGYSIQVQQPSSYTQQSFTPIDTYGSPANLNGPAFTPTGPPAPIYRPPPGYQTANQFDSTNFQLPNYQPPTLFNPQSSSHQPLSPSTHQPAEVYGPPTNSIYSSPLPPHSIYGLPPTQFTTGNSRKKEKIKLNDGGFG